MYITTFLAQMWGPILLAIGIGIFVERAFYIKIYRDLEKDVLAVLVFGMASMAVGIAQISYHNSWTTLPEILVSFLGWGLLAKGVLFLVAPGFVDRAGDVWVYRQLTPLAGTLMVVIGGYLTWFAYVS